MAQKIKFDSNLLRASAAQTIDAAKGEWRVVCERTLDWQSGQCICGYKVKKIIYIYNVATSKIVLVGQTCHTKFGMPKELLDEPMRAEVEKKLDNGYIINDNVVEFAAATVEMGNGPDMGAATGPVENAIIENAIIENAVADPAEDNVPDDTIIYSAQLAKPKRKECSDPMCLACQVSRRLQIVRNNSKPEMAADGK